MGRDPEQRTVSPQGPVTLGPPWDRGAASTAFLLPPFTHSYPSASPPRTSGSHSSEKTQSWGHGFPRYSPQPFLQEAPQVEESPRKRVGELVLPGNWDPSREGRGVRARPRREPQTVCGWWVEGVSRVGHSMRALIHCALTVCQTELALYTLSHLTFKRKPQDAISMPI